MVPLITPTNDGHITIKVYFIFYFLFFSGQRIFSQTCQYTLILRSLPCIVHYHLIMGRLHLIDLL